MLELILVAVLAGILISVVGTIWLSAQVPSSSSAHSALFSAGTIHPYNLMVSLRVKFFLPWVPLPDFSGCGSFAWAALALSRLGAYVALFALIGLVFVGLVHA